MQLPSQYPRSDSDIADIPRGKPIGYSLNIKNPSNPNIDDNIAAFLFRFFLK